jgi:hypothetical protein
MSLSRAEVPGSGQPERVSSSGEESMPKITALNRGLYELTFYILGSALLLLIAGWIILATMDRTVPDGLPVVVATIVGALTGVIATDSRGGGR